MNRLYLHFSLYVLIALLLSLLVANYLSNNPIFTRNDDNRHQLNSMADKLEPLLKGKPVTHWEGLVQQSGFDDQFDINWYATNEMDLKHPDVAALVQNNRQFVVLEDGTEELEVLFAGEQEILVVSSYQRGNEILNLLFLVGGIITICAAIAALALKPVIARLQQIQTLAGFYRQGQWQARNTDQTNDPIGELGNSLQQMADQIQVLVTNNETLVKDQRDLMQALTHEFRAPMARMRFALEMYDDDRLDANSHAEISAALDDQTAMISEMLYYARLQNNAPQLHPDLLSLPQLIEESCTLCRKVNPDATITFKTTEDFNIYADATHLQRAISNLISNAAKYGNSKQCIVQVSVEKSTHKVAIHVDDNGSGIPVADRQSVFKPFVRLDASRSKKISGNGLGLAIVQRVALKHRGQVEIGESGLGGARFSFVIPLVDTASQDTAVMR